MQRFSCRAGLQGCTGPCGRAVRLLARGIVPGFSVHDELALLVEAGLTPMDALQTATRNPARYLDRLADLGTVEKGKIADLVLLDANPLDDIKNTQRIAAVVVCGKLLRQVTPRKMLTDVEQHPAGSKKIRSNGT